MTYIAISLIREPLRDPVVSTAGRKPTRGLHVHYCYSAVLQNGGEYAENRILSSIIYGHAHAGTWSIVYTSIQVIYVVFSRRVTIEMIPVVPCNYEL